jgi:tRNA-Thr(GGU) m(6)t(6)A37 methyltransferase TsaA
MSATTDAIRPGETAIELPSGFDAGLYYIGRIRTPWRRREDCPKNANESRAAGIVCTIELDTRYAEALNGVETCAHLLVLYWMHQARRDLVIQTRRHSGTLCGTFALRSPVRPNPIAASVVDLRRVEGTRLTVVGLDCLDDTPLLDLKPHFASTDTVVEAAVHRHAQQKVED